MPSCRNFCPNPFLGGEDVPHTFKIGAEASLLHFPKLSSVWFGGWT